MSTKAPGFVYILTNPSYPKDCIKIGKTSRTVEERVKELDNTSVPTPFVIYATMKTTKYNEVEKLVHNAIDELTNYRIRKNREFFFVTPETALNIFLNIANTIDEAEVILYKDNKPIDHNLKADTIVEKPRKNKSIKNQNKERERAAPDSTKIIKQVERKTSETNQAADKATLLNKDLARSFFNSCLINYNKLGLVAANKDIDKAIEYDKYFANAYYIKSLLEFEQGNYANALKDLDYAKKLKDDVVETLPIRTQLTGKIKELDKAINESDKDVDYSTDRKILIQVQKDRKGIFIIPNGVTKIGDEAFKGCSSLTWIEIPKSVTKIGNYAFLGCNSLTSLEIPNSVTEIGFRVFAACSSLTSIKILCRVTEIGDFAFEGCKKLTSIDIPDSVTKIGNSAFARCTSLKSIIQNCITRIGNSAFSGCTSLTSIVIPNSVTKIGDYAFSCCTSLDSIEIPNSVTKIGRNAFEGCTSLKEIYVNEGNPNFCSKDGVLCLKDMSRLIAVPGSKTSIVIPNCVTEIGDYAFCGSTSLTSIEIPNSVTEIGHRAFKGCTNLTSIVIPNSVTEIGVDVCEGCSNLVELHLGYKNPIDLSISFDSFINILDLSKISLYVPKGSGNAYRNDEFYKRFKNIIEE